MSRSKKPADIHKMPEESRRKRLIKGLLAKGLGQGGQLFIRFAEVPLMLAFWGTSLYGQWLILTALPIYLTLSDFGFAGATNRHMAILVSQGQKGRALAFYQTSTLFVFALSALVALVFALCMTLIPIKSLFNLTDISQKEILIVILAMSAQIVTNGQIRLMFGGFYCSGHYPVGMLILSAIPLLKFVIICIVVILGGSPGDAAIAMLVGDIIGMLWMRLKLYRLVPWIKMGFKFVHSECVRILFKPALGAMAFPIGEASSYQIPRLVIGALIDPVAVTIFVTHRQLARLTKLATSSSHVFQAELSQSFGKGDRADFLKLSRRSTQILLWGALLIAIFLLLIAHPVYSFWTGGKTQFDLGLFLILFVGSLLEACWRSVAAPAVAINRHVPIGVAYLLSNLLLIPLLFVTIWWAGLDGAGTAIILAEAAVLVIALKSMLAVTNDSLIGWLQSAAKPDFLSFMRLPSRAEN